MTVPAEALPGAGSGIARVERAVREVLTAQHVEGAETAARLMVMKATGLSRTGLIVAGNRPLGAHEQVHLADMVTRRLAREPLQRILGDAEFWGLTFRLSPATLVPRADTETLVEAVLARFAPQARLTFADLGTGSGAILAAILHERPRASGIGIDLSPEAVETAAANLDALGLAGRARLCIGDFTEPLPARGLDLVVSNPPYVESAEIDRLQPEVAAFEPRLALDGGKDGLAAYRALLPQARAALAPGGHILVEIGWDQAETVSILMEDNGFSDIAVERDLAGQNRVVAARLPGGETISMENSREALGIGGETV